MSQSLGKAYQDGKIGPALTGALTGKQPSEADIRKSAYNAPGELADAFFVALVTRQPLLLTGLPGVGKTAFAEHVAACMGLDLEIFNVKTRTEGREFLYSFDDVARFRDANDRALIDSHVRRGLVNYVTPHGLGLAILRAIGPTAIVQPQALDRASPHILPGRTFHEVFGRKEGAEAMTLREAFPQVFPDDKQTEPKLVVVLIDEIDKAPRDAPNDLLDEFDRMRFDMREAGIGGLCAPQNYRPIVIVTSNNERQLPPAFLRRCVYHHLELAPDRLQEILAARMKGNGKDTTLTPTAAQTLAARLTRIFTGLHQQPGQAERRPGTAEFLGAAAVLLAEPNQAAVMGSWRANADLTGRLAAVLAKTNDEVSAIRNVIETMQD